MDIDTKELQGYVDRMKKVRLLSTPDLDQITDAEGYSKLLLHNFSLIGMMAAENRKVIDQLVKPNLPTDHALSEEVRAKLWDSILEDITEEEARVLAARYDFTGGQIENIARKLTVDFILTGQQASLDVIGKYCEAELMDKSRTIGFTYKKN